MRQILHRLERPENKASSKSLHIFHRAVPMSWQETSGHPVFIES